MDAKTILANKENKIFICSAIAGLMILLVIALCDAASRSPRAADYRNPALKQELVGLASALRSDTNVRSVKAELESILKIYDGQLAPAQKKNLLEAWQMLDKMRRLSSEFRDTQIQSLQDEYVRILPQAQERIQSAGALL